MVSARVGEDVVKRKSGADDPDGVNAARRCIRLDDTDGRVALEHAQARLGHGRCARYSSQLSSARRDPEATSTWERVALARARADSGPST